MQGWYYVESLTGQRHDRVQTAKPRIATVDSCFDLVGSCQHGVASYMKYLAGRLISIYSHFRRWNSNPNFCQLADVTCKTRDKGQQEKSRISCRCRDKETADRQTVPRENHGETMLKRAAFRIWKTEKRALRDCGIFFPNCGKWSLIFCYIWILHKQQHNMRIKFYV